MKPSSRGGLGSRQSASDDPSEPQSETEPSRRGGLGSRQSASDDPSEPQSETEASRRAGLGSRQSASDDPSEPQSETEASSDDDQPFDAEPVDPDDLYGERSHLDATGKPKIIERDLIVPAELAGLRLDHFVKTQIARLSRTKIQTIIETQLRRADGFLPKPATKVAEGEHYIIRREAKPEPPCPRTFTVVHEDARMRIIDKPAGLPVHATAKFYYNTLARVMWERYPAERELQMCHRLDRETSGCMVIARDREAASYLKQAISEKQRATKEYLAVVYGAPAWDEIVLDQALRISTEADDTRLPTVKVLVDPRGMTAATRVVVEQRGEPYSLVRCTLLTGRQHQIRVHLAHAGFPIVGDKIYAHGDAAFIDYCDHGLTPELARLFVLPRHALHAARITVPHPDGGLVTGEAPLPADLAALLPAPGGVG